MADTRLKIAVFIDFDNIEIGVKSTLGVQFDIGVVLEALKERGDVVSKIAYGDWTRAGDYSRSLTQHATKLVQRNLTPGGDKNGADINLALDALEMAFTHGHINAYVIVGGDSDFITLVEKLKQYDKQIFVVGGRAFTSMVMQRNCHEFIAYENLVNSGRRSSADRGRPSGPVAQTSIEVAVPLVRRALKVLSDREVSPQLGLLKSTLLQLDSTFSERTYGAGSFRDFAQKLASAGHVALRESGRNVLVELAEGSVGTAPEEPRDSRPQQYRSRSIRSRSLDAKPRMRRRQPPLTPQRPTAASRSRGRQMGSGKCGGCSSPPRIRRGGRCISARRSSSCATSTPASTRGSSGSPVSSTCCGPASARASSESNAIGRVSCALFPGNIMQAAEPGVAGVAGDDDNRGNVASRRPSRMRATNRQRPNGARASRRPRPKWSRVRSFRR